MTRLMGVCFFPPHKQTDVSPPNGSQIGWRESWVLLKSGGEPRSEYPKNSLFQRCLRLLKYHPCLVSTLTFPDSIRDEVLLTLTLLGNLEHEIFNYPIKKK